MSRSLIVSALLEMIPEGRNWAADEQSKWLKAAKEIFALVYSGQGPGLQVAHPSPQAIARATRGQNIPSPELQDALSAALPELFAVAPEGVTARMIQDRFSVVYAVALALTTIMHQQKKAVRTLKPGSNTIVLLPPDTVLAETSNLSANQQAVLDSLRKMPGTDGWIEVALREISKAAGIPHGTTPSVIESLERKGYIEVERRGGDGLNRYKVVVPA